LRDVGVGVRVSKNVRSVVDTPKGDDDDDSSSSSSSSSSRRTDGGDINGDDGEDDDVMGRSKGTETTPTFLFCFFDEP